MNKSKVMLIGCVVLLVVLVLADLILSAARNRQSAVLTTIQSITDSLTSNTEAPTPISKPEPTTDPLAGLPTSYKDIPIPSELYRQGFQKYKNAKTAETRRYILNRVQRYYIFRDFMLENNISFQFIFPLTFATLEQEVPKMEMIMEQNAITNVEFAYIKARFRHSPSEDVARSKFGSLETKARELIEGYRQRFVGANPNAQQIVADSNLDPDLMLLNNSEQNEYRKDFKPNDRIFFTDSNFKSFLFAQQSGTVSDVYTLHSIDNSEYAYVFVYIVNGQKKDYSSLDEIIRKNVGFFK